MTQVNFGDRPFTCLSRNSQVTSVPGGKAPFPWGPATISIAATLVGFQTWARRIATSRASGDIRASLDHQIVEVARAQAPTARIRLRRVCAQKNEQKAVQLPKDQL